MLYDRGCGRRHWRWLNVSAQKVYVEAKALQMCRRKHSVIIAAVLLAWQDSSFTKSFEEMCVVECSCVPPYCFGISATGIAYGGRHLLWVYQDLEAPDPSNFDGLVNIGIDERPVTKKTTNT